MSGIAGIVHFDGRPVEPGEIERMTASMRHRGPDGIRHRVKGNAALGHCQMCTTPESLEETQPWANEDESLVLVMDGRVDNRDELRGALVSRGARLRNGSDAELVLRAYEEWGEDCPARIIGEFTFQIWDGRKRVLFGARDVAGTRNFHYHEGDGWFGFSSEIKALRALGRIDEKLNETRVAGYLIPALDRSDEVGTFYQGIERLPAGHAMTVSAQGMRKWRYWDPSELPELKTRSLDECAEGFAAHLRTAVKCRLRSTQPLAAMLSGGLDSSSVVALILKEHRGDLHGPLHTITLTGEDRERCLEYEHASAVNAIGGSIPHIVEPPQAAEHYEDYWAWARTQDEPFTAEPNHTYYIAYRLAGRLGLRTVLDGMAGDLCFQLSPRYLHFLFRGMRWGLAFREIWERKRLYEEAIPGMIARHAVYPALPAGARGLVRRLLGLRRENWGEESFASPEFLRRVDVRRTVVGQPRPLAEVPRSCQSLHARSYTTGCLSFAQERNSLIAASLGIETRSPFADRRLIEYAVSMPLEAKLLLPRYKEVLRRAMRGVLPERTLRRRAFAHPGPAFTSAFCRRWAGRIAVEMQLARAYGSRWLDTGNMGAAGRGREPDSTLQAKETLCAAAVFCHWIRTSPFASPGALQESGQAKECVECN